MQPRPAASTSTLTLKPRAHSSTRTSNHSAVPARSPPLGVDDLELRDGLFDARAAPAHRRSPVSSAGLTTHGKPTSPAARRRPGACPRCGRPHRHPPLGAAPAHVHLVAGDLTLRGFGDGSPSSVAASAATTTSHSAMDSRPRMVGFASPPAPAPSAAPVHWSGRTRSGRRSHRRPAVRRARSGSGPCPR